MTCLMDGVGPELRKRYVCTYSLYECMHYACMYSMKVCKLSKYIYLGRLEKIIRVFCLEAINVYSH